MLGEPPAGLGAEGGRGGAGQGAGVRQRAEGEVQLSQEPEVLAATLGGGGAHDLRGGDAGLAEPLPEGAGLAAAGPGIAVEAEELDVLHILHGLARQLGQGVVEEVEDGQAAQIAESPAVDLLDAVLVEEEAVQVDQASEHVLGEGADAVPMQEQVCQVDQV